MSDDAYYQLRDLLERMPHGFPRTEDGLEIRILKKIFTEEEAAIASQIKIKYETAEAVALRTGMDAEYLKTMLPKMVDKGQILGVNLGGTKI
jgi:Na+-translocating ferredoxin:NAD+ oxidoreductase subunit B